MVKRGYVVLAFDPPGQGERLEYFDTETGKSRAGVGVPEHIVIDAGPAPRRIMKTDIARRTNGPSAMPPMGSVLTRREIRDVIEYLSTLK